MEFCTVSTLVIIPKFFNARSILIMDKLKKIIEYGLYLLVFLLPWQTRLFLRPGILNRGYFEYGTISLYGTDILLILILLLFVVYKFSIFNPPTGRAGFQFSNKLQFSISKIWWIVGGIDLFIFISIFFAPDKILAVYHYILFLLGVGLFWLITSVKYDKAKFIWSLTAGIFLQACLGIWQFLTQSTFAFKWLGLAEHPAANYSSVIETIGGGRWLRAYGGLDNPNILGGVLVVAILLLFCHSELAPVATGAGEESRLDRISRDPSSRKFSGLRMTLILFTIYCLLFTTLFFTFSRAAWLGLAIGLAAILILAIIKKDFFAQKSVLKIILIGALVFFIFGNIYSDLLSTRLSDETRLEIKSNTERIESFSDAKNIIKKHWLFGVGIGNYTLALSQEKPGLPFYLYQPTHNVFLLIWSEIGIFGLAFFLLFLLSTFYYLLSNLKKEISIEAYSYLAIIIALLVIFQFDHWWWSLHFGVLFFWMSLGLLYTVKELQ
ncbi:MAG: O-antigen ligase family protein [Patescibacteria group bacterium]|nr:O-antigen ligase family protein [Patescibacteria group bacterium]MDD4610624.1 O-antigen ligase family protein [Patescibacteria group bacterium]